MEAHPNITWYKQCITYNVFNTYTLELSYSIFGMMMMYTFPLIIIVYSYASILLEIYRKLKESGAGKLIRPLHGPVQQLKCFRRSHPAL